MEEVVRERDFYRSLVNLATCESLEPLANQALRTLIELTGAREAYIELRLDPGEDVATWSAADGCDAQRVDEIRGIISRGIVARAVATGDIVVTPSAMHDDRFRDLRSVREHAIETVLCVPIGREAPIGVVYLQGAARDDARSLDSPAVLEHAQAFARVLEPIAEQLFGRERASRASDAPTQDAFTDIVGRSRPMRELVQRLRLVSSLDIHVLLTGPSGAGKSMLASAIHHASARRLASFVALNCAAIPEALLENELFGAEPGAHSAVPRGGVRGKVDAAEGGTLFLDEVGELSLSAQAKLLQLLQDRTYYRLGGTSPRHADVRILAATNVNLETAVRDRKFREDLYYRLKVFEAHAPPLSERMEDAPALASRFCAEAAARHKLSSSRLAPSAVRAIMAAPWPGNVRELAHRVESAALHAHMRGAELVEASDLFPDDARGPSLAERPRTLQDATRAAQRAHVLATLEATDWNVSEAARRLDIARSYLYTLVRAYDLRRS